MCSYLGRLESLQKSVAILELGDESLYVNFFPIKNNRNQIKTEFIRPYAIMGVVRDMYSKRYVKKKKLNSTNYIILNKFQLKIFQVFRFWFDCCTSKSF